MGKERKPLQFAKITVKSYKNAVVVKTKNRTTSIIVNEEDPDKCILEIRGLIDKSIIVPGQPITCIETVKKNILEVQIGMTTSSLQILHFLIGNYLKKHDVESFPVDRR